MNKTELAAALLVAFQAGYRQAAEDLKDAQLVHEWMGQFDRGDLYDLMPSARRSAAAFLEDSIPNKLPAQAI